MLNRLLPIGRKVVTKPLLVSSRSFGATAAAYVGSKHPNTTPSHTKNYDIIGFEVNDPDTNKPHFVRCSDNEFVHFADPEKFYHQAALHINFAAKGKDPMVYLRSLLTHTYPHNMEDALVLDMLMSYWGLEKGENLLPITNIVSVQRLEVIFNELSKEFAKTSFDSDSAKFNREYQEKLDNEEVNGDAWIYYKTLVVGLPFLSALILYCYAVEFGHIKHNKHEQMDRITGKSHGGGHGHH